MQIGTDLEASHGSCLVEVHAQVMEYDDTVGGWVPLDGGGMSIITLHQFVVKTTLTSPSPVTDSCPGATSAEGSSQIVAVTSPYECAKILEEEDLQTATKSSVPIDSSSVATIKHEYVLQGRRIDDRKVLLRCTVCRDAIYRLMSPYLHTYTMGNKRFGLCFKSSYEACLFQKELQKAIDHLYSQSKSSSGESNPEVEDLDDDVFVSVDLPVSRDESSEGSSVGAGLGLPSQHPQLTLSCRSVAVQPTTSTKNRVTWQTPSSSRSVANIASASYPYVYFSKKPESGLVVGGLASSGATSPSLSSNHRKGGGTGYVRPHHQQQLLGSSIAALASGTVPASSEREFPRLFQSPPCEEGYKQPYRSGYHQLSSSMSPSSYTQRLKSNRIPYYCTTQETGIVTSQPLPSASCSALSTAGTVVGSWSQPRGDKRESVGSLKLPSYALHHAAQPQQPFSKKMSGSTKDIIERAQCFYCKQWFRTDQNEPGSCAEAPNPCEIWVERLSCLWCAKCAVYCCLHEDSDLPQRSHVCSCSDNHCCGRWTVLSVLAILFPCLCCYLPLKACQICCSRQSWSGGRHKPI